MITTNHVADWHKIPALVNHQTMGTNMYVKVVNIAKGFKAVNKISILATNICYGYNMTKPLKQAH